MSEENFVAVLLHAELFLSHTDRSIVKVIQDQINTFVWQLKPV